MVIHQDDLTKQVGWCSVQHAVNGPQQGGECLVKETDHYAGRRESKRIHLIATPAERDLLSVTSGVMVNES